MGCPACDGKLSKTHGEAQGVRVCARCEAVYTTRAIYLGESYQLVVPLFDAPGACEPGAERYFDFETLGSEGLGRRHGWFNPVTRRIVQVG